MNESDDQNKNSSAENGGTEVRASRPRTSKAGTNTVGRKRRPKLSRNATPAARPATKTAKVLALLRRPSGASLQELRKATGWEPHSVRGFLSGTVKKKMGLRIDSVQRDNDERAYHLASK